MKFRGWDSYLEEGELEYPWTTRVTIVPTPSNEMGRWLVHQDYDCMWDPHSSWVMPNISGRRVCTEGYIRFKDKRHKLLFDLAFSKYIVPTSSGA